VSDICVRCKEPGAGVYYRGMLLHMACRLEMKADNGEIDSAPAPHYGKSLRAKAGRKNVQKRWDRVRAERAAAEALKPPVPVTHGNVTVIYSPPRKAA
jgi:hypothetical protein